ncbi:MULTISPECIES: response regulator [Spirosoma]|uniref:Response regulator n=1 Tax=Spirosoma liriopis TaxID=2937440 RepID=A0ABT0HPY5_9BACT|nr:MULTISPECIES: response regulator [Spirosoma]MCK8493912.1 response regulator [Spirosoma liriopis]UHG93563.1 response regulator [Spirosoma oryzicola]
MQTEFRVFIVDDEADYRFLTGQVFTRFLPQYPVRFFTSGSELQQHILTEPPEQPALIILDLHMPVLNGHQTLRYLKQHPQWRHIPVVMMSNTVDQAEIASCYEAGVNSFLGKPDGLTQFQTLYESVCTYWLVLNKLPKNKVNLSK